VPCDLGLQFVQDFRFLHRSRLGLHLFLN
jgi:hypothetical protein